MSIPFFLLLVALCLSALFAGSETGWYAMNPLKLRHLAQTQSRAALLERVVNPPSAFLTTLLVGNNFANSLAVQAGILLAIDAGLNHPETWATLFLTPFVFIFGEVAPKQYVAADPLRRTLHFVIPLFLFRFVLLPVTAPIAMIARHFAPKTSLFAGRRQLAALLMEAQSEGPRESKSMSAALEALSSKGRGLSPYLSSDVLLLPHEATIAEAQQGIAANRNALALIPVGEKIHLLLATRLVDRPAKDFAHAVSLPIPYVDMQGDLAEAFACMREEKVSFALVPQEGEGPALLDLEQALATLLHSTTLSST